jgi:protein O-GlcNAc transferase
MSMISRHRLSVVLLALSLATPPGIVVAQDNSVEQLLRQGTMAGMSGNHVRAEEIFRKIVQIDPKNAKAYKLLGDALRLQKKYESATEAYQKAIQLNPNNAITNGSLGSTLLQQLKYDRAIDAYKKAIQLAPNDFRAYSDLGMVLSQQGKYDRAIDAYKKAIQLAPNDFRPYGGLGNTLRRQSRYDQAITAYKKVIQLAPNDSRGYDDLGMVLSRQGKYTQAIIELQKAIKLNPKNAAHYNNIGNVLRLHKNIEKSIAAYRKAIQLDPNSARAYYNLGFILKEEGRYEEALAAFQSVMQTKDVPREYWISYPDEPATNIYTSAHNETGLIFRRLGQLIESIKQFEIAEVLDSNYIYARNNSIEARRLLTEQENQLSQLEDDRQWLRQNDTNLKIKRSVVRIITEFDTEERPGTEFGTGIVISRSSNRTLILTARHIIYDRDKQSKNIQVEFFSSQPANRVRMRRSASPLKIITNDEKFDLVVVEITDPLPEDIQPLSMSLTAITNDMPIRIIGHDANRGSDLSWSVVSGKISSNDRQTLTISQANIKPGYSGSPVLDSQNRLLGIIIETRKDKKQDFALSIAVIKNQLSLWNISLNP